MQNCGPHGTDLSDHREQVEIFTLPPKCTAKLQPMDMCVIAAFKLRYRRLFLARIIATIEERDEVRAAAKNMKAGMRGLDEGYDPHMLDVADLVKQPWEGVSEKTIAQCWIKADILPRAVQGELPGVFGKVRGLKRLDDEYEDQLGEVVDGLRSLKLCMARVSDLSNRMDDYSLVVVEDWICVESCENVRNALVEESDADANVMPRRESLSTAEISYAFREVENYVADVGHTVACDAIRRAKRALLDSFHTQNKNKARQTLMIEYLKE